MPPHTGFIVAAYVVTALVLAGAVLLVILDGRAQRRALERLQAAADTDGPVAKRRAS